MSYLQHPFPFSGSPAVPLDSSLTMDPTMIPPTLVPPRLDGYMYPYQSFDAVDFYAQPIMDYDEYAENLSRPRLTKEQVEILEAQFQSQSKPSSNVKRQLAAQTNLSLPRVANWFQNRRAKAKQQKRQEEFAKSQKTTVEADHVDKGTKPQPVTNNNHSFESNRNVTTPKGTTDQYKGASVTPKQSSIPTTQIDDRARTPVSVSSGPPKPQKLRSESATQDATLESLQRALNVAVAAGGDDYFQETRASVLPNTTDMPTPASSTATTFRPNDKNSQRSFSEWESFANPSVAWTTPSQSPEQSFPYANVNTASFASSTESLPNLELDNSLSHQNRGNEDAYMGLPFIPPGKSWTGYLHTPTRSFSGSSSCPTDPIHNALPYNKNNHNSNGNTPSSLQQPVAPVSRRGSSDDLADSLENVGIDTTSPYALPQIPQHVDTATSWKIPGQQLDLAARRKRPRPAAIGTTAQSSHPLGGPSTMSPTTRMPGFHAVSQQGVRHSKSAQNLSSRYAGVRKASATPRSPFSRPALTEAGTLKSKAEMSKRLRPSVSTNNLAPSTPMTPEDLQSFHPSTPSDRSFYLSGLPSDRFLTTASASRPPAHVTIASPPSTPLPVGAVPMPFRNQNLAPPMSAPPQYTTFPDYAPCQGPSVMGGWTDTVPDNAWFQHSTSVAPPGGIPPIYEPVLDENWVAAGNMPYSGISPLDTSNKGATCSI